MADEAPQSVAPATTPASTPTSTATAPGTSTAAPSTTVDYQKQYTEMKEKHDALMGLVTYDQEAKTAVQRAYNRARGIPDATPPKEGEETETPPAPVAPAGPTHVDIAFNKLATKLGSGDPYRGQEIFTKEYLPEFEKAAGILYGNDADAKVALLSELVSLRKGGQAPAQTASTRLLDPGFSGERGEAGAAPTPPPDMSKWTAYQRADYHSRQTTGVGIDELTRAAFAS